MKLVIGGCFQGKMDYVLNGKKEEDYLIFDGRLPEKTDAQQAAFQNKTVLINHLHEWVRACLSQGENPEKEILEFVSKHPQCIVICDEIGNGIVPTDAFEREYRERMGRILIRLAQRADEVERVICGIGQKIK